MPKGPGKYDHLACSARDKTQADGLVLIVLNGIRGSGFSVVATDPGLATSLPGLLRDVADEIERSQ